MKKKNDPYQFQYPLTVTLSTVVNNQSEVEATLRKIMSDMADPAEKALKLLLTLRGKKYCLNDKLFDEGRVKEDLKALRMSHNIDMDDETFHMQCQMFYKDFITTQSRGWAGYILNESKIKVPSKNSTAFALLNALLEQKISFERVQGTAPESLYDEFMTSIGKNPSVVSDGTEDEADPVELTEQAEEEDKPLPPLAKITFKQFEKLLAVIKKEFADEQSMVDQKTKLALLVAMREAKVFPLANNLSSSGRFILMGLVHEKLKSFEKLFKIYESEKDEWHKKIEKATSSQTFPLINQYSDLLMQITKIEEHKGFSKEHFDNFINRWNPMVEGKKPYKGLLHRKEGMRALFLVRHGENPDQTEPFQPSDKFLFGYDHDFMNLVFRFKELWLDANTIGDKAYAKLISSSYHYRLESISLCSFTVQGSLPVLILGNNYVPFDLEMDGNLGMNLKFAIHTGKNDKTFYNLRLARFLNTATLTKGENKGTYSLEYTRDSKNVTKYTCSLNEPRIRWDANKNRLYVHFPVSNHCEAGREGSESIDKMAKSRYWFMSTPTENGIDKDDCKVTMEGSFRAMGVDIGMVNPWTASIFQAEASEGKATMGKHLTDIRCNANRHKSRRLKTIKAASSKVDGLKGMTKASRDYYTRFKTCADEEVTTEGTFQKISQKIRVGDSYIDWNRALHPEMTTEDREAFLTKFLKTLEDCTVTNPANSKVNVLESLINLRKSGVFSRYLYEIGQMVSSIKGEYHQSTQKAEHTTTDNHIDKDSYEKCDLVQRWVSVRRAISTMGMTSTESQGIRNGFCRHDQDYILGLKRHITNSMASDIVNAARANKVSLIVVEDFNCHQSAMDSQEDNTLKRLIRFGELSKALALKANKHAIMVVKVDPSYTSQIHFESGRLGYRKGRNLTVFDQDGKIEAVTDADFNASRNIAKRAFERHCDLNVFAVDEIENEKVKATDNPTDRVFRYAAKENPKRKTASFFQKTKARNGLFKENSNNSAQLFQTDLGSKILKTPVLKDSKRRFVIWENGSWSFLDIRVKQMEAQFELANQRVTETLDEMPPIQMQLQLKLNPVQSTESNDSDQTIPSVQSVQSVQLF